MLHSSQKQLGRTQVQEKRKLLGTMHYFSADVTIRANPSPSRSRIMRDRAEEPDQHFTSTGQPYVLHGLALDLFARVGGICPWKPYLKASVARIGTNLNVTAMLSDDGLYSVQPQTSSFTNALGREKWIKDMGLYLRRNSRAAIADFDHNIVVIAESSHPKFTLTEHGVDRVLDEVGPDLIQLSSHRVNQ